MIFTPEKIREIRERLSMSQENFAEILGISKTSVYRWESGERHPRYEHLLKLEELLRDQQVKRVDWRRRHINWQLPHQPPRNIIYPTNLDVDYTELDEDEKPIEEDA